MGDMAYKKESLAIYHCQSVKRHVIHPLVIRSILIHLAEDFLAEGCRLFLR